MTTFALVHGAGTVGASWAAVAVLLSGHGHAVVAPDLPMEDPAATFADYADVVSDALGDADDVVLVGHSMGGTVVPLVAASRPVRACVYVCAMVPVPGESLRDTMAREPMVTPAASAALGRGEDGLIHWDPAGADTLLFAELAPGRVAAARAALRGHAPAPYRAPCPLDALPDIPSVSVVCAADGVIDPDWSATTGAARLGADVVGLPGGHMPMLTRPRELAATIERAAGVPA